MNRYLFPLLGFAILAIFLGIGLKLDPREIPSPLIDKQVPDFSVPRLYAPDEEVSARQFRGQVWMLNVFASWCLACRDEHPLLNAMAEKGVLPIIGLNYKDEREDAQNWLAELGNPYTVIAHDLDGAVGIDFGVYGVPESFVIDKQGLIRFKQIGPLDKNSIEEKLIPLINELRAES